MVAFTELQERDTHILKDLMANGYVVGKIFKSVNAQIRIASQGETYFERFARQLIEGEIHLEKVPSRFERFRKSIGGKITYSFEHLVWPIVVSVIALVIGVYFVG